MTERRDPLPTDVILLPPLPSVFDATLDSGLGGLGIELDARDRTAMADHIRLLLAWTEAINLTSIREPAAAARDHVLDSLSAVPMLRAQSGRAILDLGSGGGFPGLPIAIALPAERALLVESVGKKATFLATVIDALGLRPRVGIAATRAERLAADPHHRARWPIVTARAIGSLAECAELALPLAAPRGIVVVWKRRAEPDALDAELAAGSRAAELLGGAQPIVHDVAIPGLRDHVLVTMDKVRATPGGWPRDPAARKRRPW